MADAKQMDDRISALETLVAGQRAEIARLRELVGGGGAGPTSSGPDGNTGTHPGPVVDRRAVLRRAGSTAVGAVLGAGAVALAAAPSAAAATGDPLVLGQKNAATFGTTLVADLAVPTLTVSNELDATPTLPPLGENGVVMAVESGTTSMNGLAAGGPGDGVLAWGGRYGLVATGNRASIRLRATGFEPPFLDDEAHVAGELTVTEWEGQAQFWVCVVSGTPGGWRLISEPDATTFVPSAPVRVYDSRTSDGPIAGGQSRTITLGHEIYRMPTAFMVNLTIVDTVGSGWLRIGMNEPPSPPTHSSINWYGAGQIVANCAVTLVDGQGRARVDAGGPGRTQFVVDVSGVFL